MKTLCGIAVGVLGLWGTAAALMVDMKTDGTTLMTACTAVRQGWEQPRQLFPTSQDAYYEGYCMGLIRGIITVSDGLKLSPQYQFGPTGGNVRPEAISSNTFFNNGLVAHCTVDDHSAEFPKTTSTGNFWPDFPRKSASAGHLCRQSASAGM
jgi:hypothetical protein